jgi:hypothetical protein
MQMEAQKIERNREQRDLLLAVVARLETMGQHEEAEIACECLVLGHEWLGVGHGRHWYYDSSDEIAFLFADGVTPPEQLLAAEWIAVQKFWREKTQTP